MLVPPTLSLESRLHPAPCAPPARFPGDDIPTTGEDAWAQSGDLSTATGLSGRNQMLTTEGHQPCVTSLPAYHTASGAAQLGVPNTEK